MIEIHNPYDGSLVGQIHSTSPEEVSQVMHRARLGARRAAMLSRNQRAEILEVTAIALAENAEDHARLIVAEAGKTIAQARKEVARAGNTLRLSAMEARRNAGEVIPFDAQAGSENRRGWFSREPLGIILAITPYNDPLNLVAHKLGPAIAGGNAVVLKPSEHAPLSAVRLVDLLVQNGLPQEVVTTVVGPAETGRALVVQRDIRMVSFTGGFATAQEIMRDCGIKRVSMELGGNGAVLVMGDADLDRAATACVSGAFWAAGQNCIGSQRILVQRQVYDSFRQKFCALAAGLVWGDPADDLTAVGPMITVSAAKAAEAAVERALGVGASLLLGHQRNGAIYAPTVLEDVPADHPLWLEEAFSPIAMLRPFDSAREAIELANEPEFALHAGLFTANLSLAFDMAKQLEAGGVMINDSTDYRCDAMPFGGAKFGSMGREGVRFSYEEMTQPKALCFNI